MTYVDNIRKSLMQKCSPTGLRIFVVTVSSSATNSKNITKQSFAANNTIPTNAEKAEYLIETKDLLTNRDLNR